MKFIVSQLFQNNALLDVILAQIAIARPFVADAEVFGFPEYSSSINELDSAEKAKVESVINRIVASQKTNAPVLAVVIVGHADVARKKPIELRASFELGVSETRAAVAREMIFNGVKDRASNEVAMRLRFKTRGHGAKFLWNRDQPGKVLTEGEMKRNRRVEIFLAGAILPEPPSRDPKDRREVRIDRALRLLKEKGLPNKTREDVLKHRTKHAECLLRKLKKPGIVDVFVDGKAVSPSGVGKFRVVSNEGRACFLAEWNGNYDTRKDPLPQHEVNKFLNNAMPIFDADGFSPQRSDDEILSILEELITMIDLGINQVDLYVQKNSMMKDRDLGVGYSGDAIRPKLQKMYRDHLDDENNIYSCWA